MAELHETHRWGEEDGVPVCLDCRVEGYEDEAPAFAPCPGPPVKKSKERTPCPATMESRYVPDHTHRCIGGHTTGDHFCRDCRRWFGVS